MQKILYGRILQVKKQLLINWVFEYGDRTNTKFPT